VGAREHRRWGFPAMTPNLITIGDDCDSCLHYRDLGSALASSTITGNDTGVYYGSASATEPASPEVAISKDTVAANPDEQIVLDQGVATVDNNKLSGPGNVGIEVQQYGGAQGQAYAPAETASHDTITGQGVGVEVLSDNATPGTSPGDDFPGAFAIDHSRFLTGNSTAT
jgi:hypothetical protein